MSSHLEDWVTKMQEDSPAFACTLRVREASEMCCKGTTPNTKPYETPGPRIPNPKPILEVKPSKNLCVFRVEHKAGRS